jgi:hypothetical protein
MGRRRNTMTRRDEGMIIKGECGVMSRGKIVVISVERPGTEIRKTSRAAQAVIVMKRCVIEGSSFMNPSTSYRGHGRLASEGPWRLRRIGAWRTIGGILGLATLGME